MEKLSRVKRAAVIKCLVEGNSILATSRITGFSKNTITKVLVEVGEACSAFQDKHLRNLPCTQLQLDEVWSFVGCKEKTKEKALRKHPGDVWTWTAICADTKIIPSWRVGDRSMNTAYEFCMDLGHRFKGHVQVSSDGLSAYRYAVGQGFRDVSLGQLVKQYKKGKGGRKYVESVRRDVITGNPDRSKICTSYVERANLTIRMGNRRFTRLTNGYSKKLENHCHMLAIQFMHYNFCRKHQTIKCTPAQAAGVTEKQWSVLDIMVMVDQYHEEKLEAEYEAAFALKMDVPRTHPKTFEPTPKAKLLTPWYLDPESGGPNPPRDQRKAGVKYERPPSRSCTDQRIMI